MTDDLCVLLPRKKERDCLSNHVFIHMTYCGGRNTFIPQHSTLQKKSEEEVPSIIAPLIMWCPRVERRSVSVTY